ncbi:hypothetical protein [Microbacterium halophytorum]|uniref:hypothetical protein n=1 Tax=Microbacterium halophytorum TaxID=2067568 RepID=UPI000CFB3243|nr:hypothetical protein [Microbacterium halophytorum]
MTTATTAPAPARRATHDGARLTFGRLVRSQWITLSTLRGNIVALVLGVLATAGLSTLFALMISISYEGSGGQTMLPDYTSLSVNTYSIAMIVAVLTAVSFYAKERSTGAHRTLLAAAPRRVGQIGAKAVVIGAASFAAALIAMALSATGVAIVLGIFGNPLGIESFATDVVLPAIGASFYVAACAVFALGIGVLLRSETWAILIALVYLLMLPTVLMMLPFDWAPTVADYLLSTSGEQLVVPFTGLNGELWTDIGLTIAWPAATLGIAMAVERSRDA